MVQRYTPKQIQYNIRTRKMTTKTSRKKEKVNVEEEIMAGYTLRNILRLLWQNRFRVDRKYFLRFLYGLGVSALLWPLRTLEWLITAPALPPPGSRKTRSSSSATTVPARPTSSLYFRKTPTGPTFPTSKATSLPFFSDSPGLHDGS